MKIIIYITFGVFLSFGGVLWSKPMIDDYLKNPDPSKKYLFYLHGAIVEGDELNPTHPVFGLYDMTNIRSVLSDREDVILISEQRPKDTSPVSYAHKVANDVRSLLKEGVSAQNITVSGFSKGSMIAIRASSILQNKDLNFVFMAACNKWVFEDDEIKVAGRILSIFETTDTIGISCQPLINKSPNVLDYKELALSTGKQHGAFYKPIREWVEPLKEWVDN
jgi:hypothetical protein